MMTRNSLFEQRRREFRKTLSPLMGNAARDIERIFNQFDQYDRPKVGETATVAVGREKTAALCFDRVWSLNDAPRGIGFRAPSWIAARGISLAFMSDIAEQLAGKNAKFLEPYNKVSDTLVKVFDSLPDPESDALSRLSRAISDELETEMGIICVPSYNSETNRDREYKKGDRSVLVATLTGIPVVDEELVSWQQVQEIRKDSEMIRRFRELTHWLDGEMAGKPWQYVIDEIAIRLDRYEAALRKHGLSAVLGTLSATLDSKALLGGAAAVASLSYAGEPFWALVGGSAVVAGRAAVTVARALLDYNNVKRTSYPEISFVAELKTELGKNIAKPSK